MLKVLKSGLFTTVQDRGRYGFLNKGVPVAGYMDSFAATKVNKLLENSSDAAIMEITMMGPVLQFESNTVICLGGADISARLNGTLLKNYTVKRVQKGDVLTYGKLESGFRAYLGVKNGFQSPMVLGSRSLFNSLTGNNHLKDGDTVKFDGVDDFDIKIMELKVPIYYQTPILEVSQGPEYELLNDKQLEHLFSWNFHIANENNRMAYQLEENILGHKISMLTSATLPGTVQLTPSGKLIILMKDGQTTGGYPRVLQLSDDAINVLSQKKYGDLINFKLKR